MFVLRLIWKDLLCPAESLCTGEVWKIWWRLDFSDIFYPHTLLAFHLPSATARLGGTFIPHIPSPEDSGCTCTQLQELRMGVGKGKLPGVGGWTEMFLKGNLFSFFLCILQNISMHISMNIQTQKARPGPGQRCTSSMPGYLPPQHRLALGTQPGTGSTFPASPPPSQGRAWAKWEPCLPEMVRTVPKVRCFIILIFTCLAAAQILPLSHHIFGGPIPGASWNQEVQRQVETYKACHPSGVSLQMA